MVRLHRLVRRSECSFLILLALLFFFALAATAQPVPDQDWNLNVVLSSDALTVSCTEFVLPIDVGRILSEPDPINTEGEFSGSLRAAFDVKITLQPETGTSDTLSQINGCSHDGATILLSTHDTGDTITITDTGNIDPPGTSVTLDDPEDMLLLVLRGSTYRIIGSVATGGGNGTKVITDAVDVASAFDVGNTTDGFRIYAPVGGTPTIECYIGAGNCPAQFRIPTDQLFTIYDEESAAAMRTVDPDAPTKNAMWRINTGYEFILSREVNLIPMNDCSFAEESIVTDDPFAGWITCQDSTDDAVSFELKVTEKFSGNAAITIRVWAVKKTAGAPTGTFSIDCAAQSIREQADAYVAHNTTGQQNMNFANITTANQPEMNFATMTVNGTVATYAHIKGQCNISSVPTEIADIRISGTAVVELLSNSFSD